MQEEITGPAKKPKNNENPLLTVELFFFLIVYVVKLKLYVLELCVCVLLHYTCCYMINKLTFFTCTVIVCRILVLRNVNLDSE